MIKQIRAEQLKPDISCHDPEDGWLDRSFVSRAVPGRQPAAGEHLGKPSHREARLQRAGHAGLAHRQCREFRLMKNLRRSALAGLFALFALPFAASAADGEAAASQQAAWAERQATAAGMLAESKARLSAAKQLLEQTNLECTAKFLVNSCRNEAYQQYLKSIREARRLENEGKALERQVKKEQVADREKRLSEAAPQHAADLQARQAETEAARQASEQKAEATRIDKAKRSAAGERRKAAEAEKLRRKQAAHDAQQAEKKQQAERQAERQRQRQAEQQAAKAAANK